MKRPAFQFYPGDWKTNANLRRCSWGARGVWIEVMGLMHDSDRYGALSWPLREIAQALGCPLSLLKELADKGVMKGADKGVYEPFVYTPRSGRVDGLPVTLVAAGAGPFWYSSRMVKDEYLRTVRGAGTRFGDGFEGLDPSPKLPLDPSPKPSPKGGLSAKSGDGPSSSSSTSERKKERKPSNHPTFVSRADFARVATIAGLHAAAWTDAEQARLDGWLEQGLTIKDDIVPAIQRWLSDPKHGGGTHTLARFDIPIADAVSRKLLPEKPKRTPAKVEAQSGEGDSEAAVRSRMRHEMGDADYDAWLAPVALRLNGEALHVAAPSTFAAEWVRNHHGPALALAAQAVAGKAMEVIITGGRVAA